MHCYLRQTAIAVALQVPVFLQAIEYALHTRSARVEFLPLSRFVVNISAARCVAAALLRTRAHRSVRDDWRGPVNVNDGFVDVQSVVALVGGDGIGLEPIEPHRRIF